MDGEAATAFAQAARQLHDEAREAKRLSGLHRRRARRLQQQLDELISSARAVGIHVHIDNSTARQGTGGDTT